MIPRIATAAVLLAVAVTASPAWADLDPNAPDVLVFTATEDDGFSRVSSEVLLNRGKAGSIRCKTSQEMVIMKFDLSSLAGWTITEAELLVCASSAAELYAADLCTIVVPWTEGNNTSAWAEAEVGDPCWDWRHRPADLGNPAPEDYWTGPDSNFTHASYGNYGSLVSYAYPADGGFTKYIGSTSGGDKTFYRIKVDPDVIHGLIVDQYGMTLSDTRGYIMQNNTVYTRDQWGGAVGPLLYLKGAVTDTTPPGPVGPLTAELGDWNGEVLLTWTAPNDGGPTGEAFGYDVRYSLAPINDGTFESADAAPRWHIPRPEAAGSVQQMVLTDLDPGQTYTIALRAYDQAGNTTAIVTDTVALPPLQTVTSFADGGFTVPAPAAEIPSYNSLLLWWAAPDTTKVNPVTGNRRADGYTGTGDNGYKLANPVWDAANNTIVLRAAKNELVAAKLVLQRLITNLTNVSVTVSDLTGPGTIAAADNIETFREWYVPSGGAYYPDVCIPLSPPFDATFEIPNADNGISGQTNQSVWVDIYVPRDAAAGTYTGTLTVTGDVGEVQLTQIAVELTVRDWALPDEINFDVDLNGYHNVWDWDGANYDTIQLSYFQLAHKHRANVNTVPYSHSLNADKSARVDGNRIPVLTGSGAGIDVAPGGWDAFDAEWGKFLDGSAFTAAYGYTGPGDGVPVTTFYSPFYESWPLSLYWYYDWTDVSPNNGLNDWYELWPGPDKPPPEFLATAPAPDKACPPEYETGVKNIVSEWAQHCQDMGWHDTDFQNYLNNKCSWGSYTNPHSQFWNLDEPTDGDCFLALGYFNQLFRDGAAMANAPDVRWHFRVDISDKTGFNRGQLDGRVNLWCCSAVNDYHPLIPSRKLRFSDEEWWYYGGGPSPSGNELTNSQRFLQVWSWGVDGALPYWNCYHTNWWSADQLAIMYAGDSVPGYGTYYGALASVRLKEMRRGQQDIEYLTALASNAPGWDRQAVTRALQAGYGDSGSESYNGMSELDFFTLREDAAKTLEIAAMSQALLPGQCEPAADGTLSKQQNNVIELVFDGPVALPVGTPLVIEPLAGGANVAAQFAYALATTSVGDDTLRAVEAGAVLTDQTWYRITPAAELMVQPFAHDVCTLIGDANGDGRVMALDLGGIWAHEGQTTDSRYDIDGNGVIAYDDLVAAWSHNGNVPPTKP